MTTYQDMIDHLTAFMDVKRGTFSHQIARRSVLEAYRDLPQMGIFTRYEKKTLFVAGAEQAVGTIQYTYTTRVATLTDSTFPTNVTERRIVLGTQAYPVAERLTSTTIRLPLNDNPGQDLDAGTTYRLIQDAFLLPRDFRKAVTLTDLGSQCQIPIEACFAPKDVDFLQGANARSNPYRAFITGGNEWGRSVLYVSPPPSSGLMLSLVYHAQPRPLTIDQFDQGTVSLSSGGTTATFTFDSGVILPRTLTNGAILRISDTNAPPTGEVGGRNGQGKFDDNPAAYEFTITERLSDSTARVSSAAPAALTAKRFTISDPIDMDGALLTAMYRLTEAAYMRFTNTNHEDARYLAAANEAKMAVKLAKEYDRTVISERGRTYDIPSYRKPVTY